MSLTRVNVYKELLRRKRARESLVDYSKCITVPGAPPPDEDGTTPDVELMRGPDGQVLLDDKTGKPKFRLKDSWVYQPVESGVAKHHEVTMAAIQRCIEKDSGRLMIFEPPGSAKSTYASVVAPTWAMGKYPGLQVIMTSYASIPIERHSKRARQIVRSPQYANLWDEPTTLVRGSQSATDWELTNGSRCYAAGLQGAITSTRCDLGIIDDPVAGRKEADSETERRNVLQAYQDDFLTRLKPNASIILIQTRWHLDDLAGSILPEDWDGSSGTFMCRDGQEWEVLCIPAECVHKNDPLGREIGEMLWPEWFNDRHWANFRQNVRTWSALFQQNPQPQSGGQFEEKWFHRFSMAEVADIEFVKFGTADWAVTEKTLETHPDYTVQGVWGLDCIGDLWLLDGDYGMDNVVKSIAGFIRLLLNHEPADWCCEAGVIRRGTEPFLNSAMEEVDKYTTFEWLPAVSDKIANAASFRALASNRKVHIVKGPFGDFVIAQLKAFPFGRYDDAVDMCGLAGRMRDKMRRPEPPPQEPKNRGVKPFTEQALMQMKQRDLDEAARRKRYTE